MTRLTLSEDPGKEFAARGYNIATDQTEDVVIFYDDVTKVHVVPGRNTFTIQILAPQLELEMDFADADQVYKALEKFENRKVVEVVFEIPKAVRIAPLLESE
jgi:hypothetical protein